MHGLCVQCEFVFANYIAWLYGMAEWPSLGVWCVCVNYSMVVGLYGLGVGVWCGCVVCRRAVYRLPPICGGRSASRESQPQLLPPVQEGRKLHTEGTGGRQCWCFLGEGAGQG